MITDSTEDQQKNILKSMVNNIQEMPPWMQVHILSFCMKASKEEKYAVILLDYILQASYDDIGEYPILLLDDFMSELDEKRRKNFLENIKNIQVIITCTDKIVLENLNYFLYNVVDGKIIEKEK